MAEPISPYYWIPWVVRVGQVTLRWPVASRMIVGVTFGLVLVLLIAAAVLVGAGVVLTAPAG